MNRITEITKRDILDLFRNGLEIDEFFQTRTVTYNYYGRLEEMDFLKRLYDLERMPSFDSRFANAEQDIWQHTVNNDDYPYCWVFEDKRFNLQDGSGEVYLKFLCEVFHPAVRYDKGFKPRREGMSAIILLAAVGACVQRDTGRSIVAAAARRVNCVAAFTLAGAGVGLVVAVGLPRTPAVTRFPVFSTAFLTGFARGAGGRFGAACVKLVFVFPINERIIFVAS